eukprot:TRINITY_DN4932_c0_g1_i1.p1 TRINITY_DN4932_c0_g1~~TRINITY_DN4932_c0_g1_i1.p1  ORF type:complete len:425 (+),score=90.73 TRINITY_DN4932_c0_g1_i1:508-1782(+)
MESNLNILIRPFVKMEGEATGVEEIKEQAAVKEGDEVSKGVKKIKRERGSTAKERISKMPPCAAGKRSSIYRGVTRHRWTGRYEAHLWDKDSWSETQNKKGKQVYLGAYDEEEAAARAYDLAALKYWGPGTNINFPVSDYSRDIEEMQRISREDYLASLRRKSSGSNRGLSKYRLAKQHVKWEPGFGRVLGTKYFNAGSCSTSEEAVGAFQMSQGDYGKYGTVKSIDLSSYIKWWQANKLVDAEPSAKRPTDESHSVSDERATQGEEAETSEWPGQAQSRACEPYQLPKLGVQNNHNHKPCSVTALSVLGQSSLFKEMLKKVSSTSEGNQTKDSDKSKNEENSKLDKGKGKLPASEDVGGSKESGCVFGAFQSTEHVNAMLPFNQVQSLAALHQGSSSVDISESLWTSYGPKASGNSLTNSECV